MNEIIHKIEEKYGSLLMSDGSKFILGLQSFAELYNDLYAAYSRWFTQPFMITEFASSSVGGDKAAWINNMFTSIKRFDRIKMAVWWDGCDWDANGNIARPYFLDETPATHEAFKKGIKLPWNTDIYA